MSAPLRTLPERFRKKGSHVPQSQHPPPCPRRSHPTTAPSGCGISRAPGRQMTARNPHQSSLAERIRRARPGSAEGTCLLLERRPLISLLPVLPPLRSLLLCGSKAGRGIGVTNPSSTCRATCPGTVVIHHRSAAGQSTRTCEVQKDDCVRRRKPGVRALQGKRSPSQLQMLQVLRTLPHAQHDALKNASAHCISLVHAPCTSLAPCRAPPSPQCNTPLRTRTGPARLSCRR